MNEKKSIPTRSILIAGAVVFALAASGFVLLYRQCALDQASRNQEAHNAILARALANVLWPRFAGHVMNATPAAIEDVRGSAATVALGREIAAFVRGTPVHRVKVYNAAGLTVFSSNLGQIGEDRADNPRFRETMNRRAPVSLLEFRDSFVGFTRTLASVHLVSSYIPIEGQAGAIEGVFELYTEADAALARVRESTARFGAAVAAIMALLYGGLVWVLRRARRNA
jgi:hypothetical protein